MFAGHNQHPAHRPHAYFVYLVLSLVNIVLCSTGDLYWSFHSHRAEDDKGYVQVPLEHFTILHKS